MSMVGYNLYLVQKVIDETTGEVYEDDLLPLHLAFGTMREAEEAKKILEQVYGQESIHIDVQANNGTCCPGEGT